MEEDAVPSRMEVRMDTLDMRWLEHLKKAKNVLYIGKEQNTVTGARQHCTRAI